jgi:hypothetical protein
MCHVFIMTQVVEDMVTGNCCQNTMSDNFLMSPIDWECRNVDEALHEMKGHCLRQFKFSDEIIVDEDFINIVDLGGGKYRMANYSVWHDGTKIIYTTFKIKS